MTKAAPSRSSALTAGSSSFPAQAEDMRAVCERITGEQVGQPCIGSERGVRRSSKAADGESFVRTLATLGERRWRL